MKNKFIYVVAAVACTFYIHATSWNVCHTCTVRSIQSALAQAHAHDTIFIEKGIYKEGNLSITQPIVLLGKGYPILDGEFKHEIISIKADSVEINGLVIQNSGIATLDDPGGIKVYEQKHILIANNQLINNFFGIYIQYSKNCEIRNNRISATGTEEQRIGNGIHCWKSDSLKIIGNTISGHRDGIYFEFVTHSVIWRNKSTQNVRYGLHFMFSNDDAYISNQFTNNGAGVAVMFTKNVIMINNQFEKNWGDASFGLLLKEISDCKLLSNKFRLNSIAVFMDGSNRMSIEKNEFYTNGWGLKLNANCMDNQIRHNNFIGNTFDVSTNGSLTLNSFYENYWDKYEGYDLNKDNRGDIPYFPLSLFSVIVEKIPSVILLYRSFFATLLDRSEKIIPSLTPQQFNDPFPTMKPWQL